MKKIFFILLMVIFISPLGFTQEPSAPISQPAPEQIILASDTTLLLHCDGKEGSTTFIDSSNNKHAVIAKGNAKVSTREKKFGTGSVVIERNGDYLVVENSTDWDFGTGDFTIDFWIRFNTISSDLCIFDVGGSQAGSHKGIGLYYMIDKGWWVAVNDAYPLQIARNKPSAGTWYHMAVVRSKGILYLFKDGELLRKKENTDDITGSTEGVTVGAWCCYDRYSIDGWIDEFRISKGVAQWTAKFTPPAVAYAVKQGKISTKDTTK